MWCGRVRGPASVFLFVSSENYLILSYLNGWAERRDAEQAADKSKVAGRKRKPIDAPAQQKMQKKDDMRERSDGTERELRKGAENVEKRRMDWHYSYG